MTKKILFILIILFAIIRSQAQVHTTYLWHLHQPTYWGDVSNFNPNRYQIVKESQDLKTSGGNNDSNGKAHYYQN